jgi:hypothetical protein
MNRRDFVLASATATATLACAVPPVQASAIFAVVFDQRFAAAQAFASTAAWRGHRVFGYDGDLTAMWLQELEPRWSRRAGALAGMTTPPALFCLEQLAAQHWLRVVTRTAQQAGPGQTLISWVIA